MSRSFFVVFHVGFPNTSPIFPLSQVFYTSPQVFFVFLSPPFLSIAEMQNQKALGLRKKDMRDLLAKASDEICSLAMGIDHHEIL